MSEFMNSQFSSGAPSLQAAEGLADAANQGPCFGFAAGKGGEVLSVRQQEVECGSRTTGGVWQQDTILDPEGLADAANQGPCIDHTPFFSRTTCGVRQQEVKCGGRT
jgi:hypothetical protein